MIPIEERPYKDPMHIVAGLANRHRLAFLDSAMEHPTLGRWSYLAVDPVDVLKVTQHGSSWNDQVTNAAPLEALRERLKRHHLQHNPKGPPFQGGAIGFVRYEAASLFEQAPFFNNPHWSQKAAVQPAWMEWAFYPTVLAFDIREKRLFLCGQAHEHLKEALDIIRQDPLPSLDPIQVDWSVSQSDEEYAHAVETIIEHILEGDIFQANLTRQYNAQTRVPPDPVATYQTLRKANGGPFSALLITEKGFIASTSPERLLRVDGQHVETRPIKGTIRRKAEVSEDERARQTLINSQKDRAENTMIVDLLRHDLSKVAQANSVDVKALCELETYAHVHHLVSVVTATRDKDKDALSVFAALFPGGSITGAPKIRAMDILAQTETTPRGVYCGSIGWLGWNGDADFNIAIRTLECENNRLTLGSGGGITMLSKPCSEVEETKTKAGPLLKALGTVM